MYFEALYFDLSCCTFSDRRHKKALDDMWASSTSLEKRWAMLSAIEEYVTALRNEVEETICE
ncbi:MAG: hypothetical protein WBL39_14065 [Terrimicrobiaceae bacterium]